MDTILQIDKIEKMVNNGKHETKGVIDVLPFTTKRTQALKKLGFHGVLGEYVRNLCKLDSPKQKNADTTASLVTRIVEEVDGEADAKKDLEKFVHEYLFGQGNSIKPIHPYLFNYVPLPEEKTNEFIKYAQFIKDVLVQDDKDVIAIFENQDSEDILTELILSKMNIPSKKSDGMEYMPLLHFLEKYYREDILFISKYKDYFLHAFPLLTHFYTFMYICQLVVKFERYDEGDYSQADRLYFALDWESINKRRKAADEVEGFKRIKEKAPHLFIHIHTMSQLSHNTLVQVDEEKKKVPFLQYSQLKQLVTEKGNEVAEQFLRDVQQWISQYSEIWSKRVTPKEIPVDLSSAFKTLFSCIKEGMHPDAYDKHGKNLEDLGALVFLKNRGSLGSVLNMNQEMLLLLTAVCVKDERIPLNRLFEKFSKRGVVFDRQSKKEIIELLDSLNILDKKSDSGDAQYVKPIL